MLIYIYVTGMASAFMLEGNFYVKREDGTHDKFDSPWKEERQDGWEKVEGGSEECYVLTNGIC
jgi:hypothetical protein